MKYIEAFCKEHQLPFTEKVQQDFQQYSDFLLEYNQNVNLTAITEPQEVEIKHFLDSLQLLAALEVKQGARLIDIGTGAGFPGVPLKIVRPDLALTLLDSLNKRLVFLEQLSEMLEQDNRFLHARAEQLAVETPFREGYDYVVSRAVSAFPALAEYCIPYVKPGGYFIAYKGPDWEQEYESAKKAITTLGGKLEKTHQCELPDGSKRALLLIKKVKQTPDKYPRQGVKIAKNPL